MADDNSFNPGHSSNFEEHRNETLTFKRAIQGKMYIVQFKLGTTFSCYPMRNNSENIDDYVDYCSERNKMIRGETWGIFTSSGLGHPAEPSCIPSSHGNF